MSNDPTFDAKGNAAVGQFYSSGGQNDSTGREPFEESIAQGHHLRHNQGGENTSSGPGSNLTSGQQQGQGYSSSGTEGLSGSGYSSGHTSGGQGGGLVSGSGVSTGAASAIHTDRVGHSTGNTGDQYSRGNRTGDHGGAGLTGDGAGRDTTSGNRDPLAYGAAGGLGQNEKQLGGHGLGSTGTGEHHGHHHGHGHGHEGHAHGEAGKHGAGHEGHFGHGNEIRSETDRGHGMTGSDGFYTTKPTGLGEQAASGAGATGAGISSGTTTTSGTGSSGLTSGNQGQYGSDSAAKDYSSSTSGIGHHGVAGGGFPSESGIGGARGGGNPNLSSGAAGTDRFDSDRTGSGATYGKNDDEKYTGNQNAGRHGDDFTGGFAATGGAYVNENTKTGLTGRETTATGVQDQHGESTQNVGLMQKVKNALGGHKNDENAAN